MSRPLYELCIWFVPHKWTPFRGLWGVLIPIPRDLEFGIENTRNFIEIHKKCTLMNWLNPNHTWSINDECLYFDWLYTPKICIYNIYVMRILNKSRGIGIRTPHNPLKGVHLWGTNQIHNSYKGRDIVSKWVSHVLGMSYSLLIKDSLQQLTDDDDDRRQVMAIPNICELKIYSCGMKRKFKQRWSSITPIFNKTIASHLILNWTQKDHDIGSWNRHKNVAWLNRLIGSKTEFFSWFQCTQTVFKINTIIYRNISCMLGFWWHIQIR
jgi:hypothetical protein